jgi:hypothetical protein
MPATVKRKESSVEAELVRRVEALGGLCLKMQSLARRGFPDRLIVLHKQIIFVELKRPSGGRLSPHQRWYAQNFIAMGHEIVLIRDSADIDRLLRPRQ